MAAFLIAGFIGLMIWQLVSLIQIINESIHGSIQKMGLYISIPILVVLYINDVFVMMLYYWGAPSFNMTRPSVMTNDGMFEFVNNDGGCRSQMIKQVITE
jgi:hypothetical protein